MLIHIQLPGYSSLGVTTLAINRLNCGAGAKRNAYFHSVFHTSRSPTKARGFCCMVSPSSPQPHRLIATGLPARSRLCYPSGPILTASRQLTAPCNGHAGCEYQGPGPRVVARQDLDRVLDIRARRAGRVRHCRGGWAPAIPRDQRRRGRFPTRDRTHSSCGLEAAFAQEVNETQIETASKANVKSMLKEQAGDGCSI